MVSLWFKNDPENGPEKLIKWVLITIADELFECVSPFCEVGT